MDVEKRIKECQKLKITKKQKEENEHLKRRIDPIRFNKYGQWMHHTSTMIDSDGCLFVLYKLGLKKRYWGKRKSNMYSDGFVRLSDDYVYNSIVLIG